MLLSLLDALWNELLLVVLGVDLLVELLTLVQEIALSFHGLVLSIVDDLSLLLELGHSLELLRKFLGDDNAVPSLQLGLFLEKSVIELTLLFLETIVDLLDLFLEFSLLLPESSLIWLLDQVLWHRWDDCLESHIGLLSVLSPVTVPVFIELALELLLFFELHGVVVNKVLLLLGLLLLLFLLVWGLAFWSLALCGLLAFGSVLHGLLGLLALVIWLLLLLWLCLALLAIFNLALGGLGPSLAPFPLRLGLSCLWLLLCIQRSFSFFVVHLSRNVFQYPLRAIAKIK